MLKTCNAVMNFRFQGCLPLVLMFDVKEDVELDQGIM